MESPDARHANDLIGSAHVLVAAILSIKHAVLAETAGKNVSFSQLKVLKLIDLCGSQRVGEVAAFLGVTDAAASKTVECLVQSRYIRRAVGKTDRRDSELSLAAAGRRLVREYDASKDDVLRAALQKFDREEVRRTVAFLDTLTEALVNGPIKHEGVCLQCRIYLRKRCLFRDAARAGCEYQRRRRSRDVITPRDPLCLATRP